MGRYGIITGIGRSGTNWLLDTMDASFHTHCRNEPYGVAGSAFRTLPQVWDWAEPVSAETYEARWDEVAHRSVMSIGDRDHQFRYPKAYVHPVAAATGLHNVLTRPRLRASVARVVPRWREGEWPLPWWVGSRARLGGAVGILKVALDRFTVGWLVANRPQVPIVHIVRHPGGRLNSWLSRFLSATDEAGRAQVLAQRRRRMEAILTHDAGWRGTIPPVEGMDLVEMEVWFWRYVNETVHVAGRGADSYRMVRYEDLAHDPVARAREVYDHYGVPWSAAVESAVRADASRSVWGRVEGGPHRKATAWRNDLDPAHVALVEQVLDGSEMATWWG